MSHSYAIRGWWRGPEGALFSADPVLDPDDVQSWPNCAALALTLRRYIEDHEAMVNERVERLAQAAVEQARKAALAEMRFGLEFGLRCLEQAHDAAWRSQYDQLGDLALEVVRRLAGELGAEAMVLGLAREALASPEAAGASTVRVHPEIADAVARALSPPDSLQTPHDARPRALVRADASLSLFGCVLETPLGSIDAGLEAQLGRLSADSADSLSTAHSEDRNPPADSDARPWSGGFMDQGRQDESDPNPVIDTAFSALDHWL